MNHPIIPEVEAKIGKIIGSRLITKTFAARTMPVGYRVRVQLPDGSEVDRTESEHEKLVRRNWPKNTHRVQPEIRLGDCVECWDNDRRFTWFGKVIAIKLNSFTVEAHKVDDYGGHLIENDRVIKTDLETQLASYELGKREAAIYPV